MADLMKPRVFKHTGILADGNSVRLQPWVVVHEAKFPQTGLRYTYWSTWDFAFGFANAVARGGVSNG